MPGEAFAPRRSTLLCFVGELELQGRGDRKHTGQNRSHKAEQYYGGCERFAGHLHVSWEGKVFLCCQDYEQSVVLGDLREESVAAIMKLPGRPQLRAEMFGLSPMSGRPNLPQLH